MTIFRQRPNRLLALAADALAAHLLLSVSGDGGWVDGGISCCAGNRGAGLILFVPLAATMFLVQRDSFRYSDHIEWPGRSAKNPWAKAFLWSDVHTPQGCGVCHRAELHETAWRGKLRRESAGEAAVCWPRTRKILGRRRCFRAGAAVAGAGTRAKRHREFSGDAIPPTQRPLWGVVERAAGHGRCATGVPYRNEAAQVCRVD